jgi:hypothetical protein
MNFGSSRLFRFLRYFSEKIAPAVHDKAMVNEGFGIWKEQLKEIQYFEEKKVEFERIREEMDATRLKSNTNIIINRR